MSTPLGCAELLDTDVQAREIFPFTSALGGRRVGVDIPAMGSSSRNVLGSWLCSARAVIITALPLIRDASAQTLSSQCATLACAGNAGDPVLTMAALAGPVAASAIGEFLIFMALSSQRRQ